MEENTNPTNTNNDSLPTVGSTTMVANEKPSSTKNRRPMFYSIFRVLFAVLVTTIAFWAGWIAQQQLAEQEDEILNDTPHAAENSTSETDEAGDQAIGSSENIDDTLDGNYLTNSLLGIKSSFEWVEESEEGITSVNESFYKCSEEIAGIMGVSEINTATYMLTLSDTTNQDAALANVESYLDTNGFVLCDDFGTDSMSDKIYYSDGRYIYVSNGTNADGELELYVELTY